MSRHSSLAPYDHVLDSGHSWLGALPSHWQCLPHRSLFQEIKSQGHTEEPLLSVTIARGVIPQAELLASTSKKDSSNLDKRKYKLVEPGDVAYNKMRAWQGAVGVSAHRGIVSPAYIVQRLRLEGLPRYYHYLFRTPAFATEAERWSYGITSDQWSLRPQHFKMIYSPVPPVDEQAAIVRYLDALDRQIYRLIQNKRRLVELVRQQEDAVISELVTSGVDRDRQSVRSSGLPWLSVLPTSWELVPLKRYWTVTDCKHLTVPFVDEGVPVASVREAQKFDLDLTNSNKTPPEWYEHLIQGGRRPMRGDLIYCRNVSIGAAAYVGSDEQFAMGQDVCLIRSRTQNNRYLNYLLRSQFMADQLASFQIGSTFSRINVADVKSLLVLVPPKAEQDEIVDYLDQAVKQFRAPIAQALQEIELIREYRSRLASDVLMGKLDVRAAAADLPEVTASEIEPLAVTALDELEAVDEGDLEELDEVPA